MAYILVAEDEIPINDLICKNLKLLGYKTAQLKLSSQVQQSC